MDWIVVSGVAFVTLCLLNIVKDAVCDFNEEVNKFLDE